MIRKALRNSVIPALMLLPLGVRVRLLTWSRRPLLWLLFHLETERVTIAPVGPAFCRYAMWLTWQGSTESVLGAYEPKVAEVLRREVKPGDVCIDIGAHLGYYAILLARLVGEKGVIVAFEPVPENFKMLQKNIELNALANVTLEPSAVNDQDGTLRLTMSSSEELTMHASACEYDVGDRPKTIEVAAYSLDRYVACLGKAPSLIQIDVEGAEISVLRGAEATLRQARPKLLIEVHGWETGAREEVSGFLSNLGYTGEVLGRRGNEGFILFSNLSALDSSGAPS